MKERERGGWASSKFCYFSKRTLQKYPTQLVCGEKLNTHGNIVHSKYCNTIEIYKLGTTWSWQKKRKDHFKYACIIGLLVYLFIIKALGQMTTNFKSQIRSSNVHTILKTRGGVGKKCVWERGNTRLWSQTVTRIQLTISLSQGKGSAKRLRCS